ncbi:MAG: N-6 DNA methylase [Bacteroidales bacterium]|nr:N-6 DNA methylase [Bacteroidales bacterium]MBR5703697.1 N-6 DNA methylase [Bacteroidales bacterium]
MAQKNTTTALSANAKAIVDAYIHQNIFEPHRAKALVIGLYSRRKNANQEIISVLKESIPTYPLSFTEEEFAILDKEYNEIVKYCHNFIVGLEKAEVNAGNVHFPSELVELCSKIIASTEEDSLYLPFAGYCDMAFALEAKSVSGFEANLSSVAFSKILFDAYGINGAISSSDTFAPKFEGGEYYDHIISFPPRLSSKDNRQIAQYTLDLLRGGLSDGGDMSLILPQGDLSSLHWTSFRRYLMENKTKFNVLTISLPAVFMPVTGVKYSLMFIEKRENPDGTFFFMDADRQEFFTVSKENRKQPQLKVESILESLKVRDERYVREIDTENNFLVNYHSFSPSRCFVYNDLPKLTDGADYFKLGDLVDDLREEGCMDSDFEMQGLPQRYVRTSHLFDDYMSCSIDYDAISLAPDHYNYFPSVYSAYANGGFAAYVNGTIKVGQISGMYNPNGFFTNNPHSNSKLIGVDPYVAHFAPKRYGKAQLDYVLRELTKQYVIQQAKKLAVGTVMQQMRSEDFFKLKIAVPSIERQDEILKQDRIAAVEKAGVKVDELNEKFRKDIHMMKHALGQTVFNLSNWMQVLNQARKKGNGILDEKAQIGGLVKVSTGEVFDNIEIAIKVLSRQVSSFDVGYGMKVSQFSLADFIDKYIETHPRPNVKYDFASAQYRADYEVPNVDVDDSDPNNLKVIEIPGEPVVLKGEALDYVEFPEEALSIIVDNIVSNAVSHGFKDPEKVYTIHFEFKPEGTSYILSISNDGEPLPADKDPEDVFVLGHTSGGGDHAGIGGYQVRSLMEDFGGKAEIVSTPGEEFKVTYKLTFTKTNLIDLTL